MLINNGSVVSIGTVDEVMTKQNIVSVYGVPMQFITTDAGRYVLPVWEHARPEWQKPITPREI